MPRLFDFWKSMGTENLEKSNYQNSSPNSNDAVATIPLTIDENNVLEGAREVLKTIRPTWNDDNIKFKVSRCFFLLWIFYLFRIFCVLWRDVTIKNETKRWLFRLIIFIQKIRQFEEFFIIRFCLYNTAIEKRVFDIAVTLHNWLEQNEVNRKWDFYETVCILSARNRMRVSFVW